MDKRYKTYLILADDSDEFDVALYYAAMSAKKKDANVAVLRVLPETDFQHWATIEERMKAEQREEAESEMSSIAKRVQDVHGEIPQIIIEEGPKSEAVLRAIESDPKITKLILASSSHLSGPGPLIEYFAGHGIEKLNVALVIVPGHLSEAKIEAMI